MSDRQGTSLVMAQTLLSAGRIEECLGELERIPQDARTETSYIRAKGEALARLGRCTLLDVYAASLPADNPRLQTLSATLRARSRLLQGDWQGAIVILSSNLLSGDPESDGPYLQLRGTTEIRSGAVAEGAASLRKAIAAFEQARSNAEIAACLNGLGIAERMLCNHRMSESCYQRAYEIAVECGAIGEMAGASLNLGSLHFVSGKLTAATVAYERAVALSNEVGSKGSATLARLALGVVACRRMKIDTALSHLKLALSQIRQQRQIRPRPAFCEYLGELRLAQGNFERARRLFHRAIRIGRTLGDPEAVFEPQYRLAEAELGLGNSALARRLAVEARDDFAARGDLLEAAFAARVAAQALLCQGEWDAAERELHAVRETLETIGEQFEIHRVRRLLAAARERTPVSDIRLVEREQAGLLPRAKDARTAPEAPPMGPVGTVLADPVPDPIPAPRGISSSTKLRGRRTAPARTVSESESAPDSVLIYGKSRVFLEFLTELDLHAPGTTPILLEGETGVGKELLARRIHERSRRRLSEFVPFNCGTSTPEMFDSELFGFVRGAFSGAHVDRQGLSRTAHLGTLLLDEIGDLSRDSQARLLRFLDNGEVRSVGSDRIERVDVRVVSATHHNLSDSVLAGRFRQDLFFRLATVRLRVPSLRERLDDLELLVHHFLESARLRGTGAPLRVEDSALAQMREYPWPGNVRELRSEVLTMARQFDGQVVTSWKPRILAFADPYEPALPLTASIGPSAPRNPLSAAIGHVGNAGAAQHAADRPAVVTAEVLEKVLRQTQGSVTAAAKLLGVSRAAVYRLARRYDIGFPAFRE